MYRCVRVVLAVVLVFAAIRHTRAVFMTAMSDQAYVNAQITALRAPIGGQLLLEPFASGRVLSAGLPLFRIANQRFGNEAAMSHWNWVKELAERLRAESDEAAIRFQQQNEVYRLHEKLFTEGLISRLAFLEEQTRLALAGSAWTNKQAQAAQADARSREIEAQVELQKEAVVAMPFDGTVWSVPARSGAQVSVHEPILEVIDPKQIRVDAFFHERHAGQFGVGTPVTVRTLDGHAVWPGTVESVRSGVGRIAYDGVSAVSPGDYARRRIAVRVRLDAASPFDAGQFFGVGRSVVVTLRSHE